MKNIIKTGYLLTPQPWFDHPAHFPRHFWARTMRKHTKEQLSFRRLPFVFPHRHDSVNSTQSQKSEDLAQAVPSDFAAATRVTNAGF